MTEENQDIQQESIETQPQDMLDQPSDTETQQEDVTVSEETTEATDSSDDKVELTPAQQAAFNKAYFEKMQAQRDAEALRKEIEALKSTPKPQTQAPAKSLEDFDFDQDAYDDYRLEQRLEAKLAERDQKQLQKQQEIAKQTQIQAVTSKFDKQAEEYLKTNPSYQQALENAKFVQYSPTLGEVVLEEGAALDHHLLLNPQLVDKLNNLSPYQLAKEVTTIVSNLNKKAVQKQSNAPTPPPIVGGGTRANVSLEQVDMKTYYEREQARLEAKARGK